MMRSSGGVMLMRRVEELGPQTLGDTVAVVADCDDERQMHTAVAAGHGEPHALLVEGREADLAATIGKRLGSVLDQVEEDLDEHVVVAEDRRQGRIVFLDEAMAAREAALRDLADALQHLVDVDRSALDRPRVGERLHAVEQCDDAVGLVADEASQLALGGARVLFEELSRAAYAG